MSVKGYSEYEQLAGGVETLFGKSSKTVIDNAQKAYQTAGMSANEYMETVTGFSASLLQSLGGDTQKASEKADMAIRDMSDNANKMGTDIESIQNAYAGFSKQNFTLLDNLKLGYGGTKTEMERLLSDAEKISGIKYDVSSYSDIVDAIHVVQTEMGITGTTAKEASSTIQGSLSSAKSAWQNLLTGLSDDKADIDKLISNFFDSVVTVGENIIPRIGIVLNGITNMIEKLAPKITAKLPSIFKQILPSVVKGATSLLTAFIGILPELSKTITTALPDFIASFETVFKGIVDSLPSLVQTFVSALPTLIPQVVSGIVDMAVYLMEHISEIIQPIIDNLPSILNSLVTTLMDNLPILIDGVISLVMGLVRATPQIIISLLQSLPSIIEKVISGLLSCLPQLIEGAIMLVIELVAHLPEIILSLIQAIPKVIESIGKALLQSAPKLWNAFTKIFSNAWEKVKEIFAKIPEWFSNIFREAWKGIQSIWNSVGKFFSGIWDGIKKAFSAVGTWFSDIFKNAVKGIKGAFDGVKTWFKNLWNGIWNVIKTPINWIIDGINSLIDGLNSLSIKIPDWVPVFGGQTWGVNIPKIAKLAKGGFVEGGTPFIAGEAGAEAVIPLENNNQWIYKFAHAFADGLSTFYDGDNLTQTPTKGAGGKVVNINLYLDNVNVKNDDDIEDVANKVSERIAEKLVAEGMAVG
jgi:phage-related protein